MLDENERIFKNGFINSNPERRKVYGNHFYSAPLGIRTFMRVYSKEHNEMINTLLYERMITKWCEFNHKLPLWVKTEIDRYINSPVFSKEEFNNFCSSRKNFTAKEVIQHITDELGKRGYLADENQPEPPQEEFVYN